MKPKRPSLLKTARLKAVRAPLHFRHGQRSTWAASAPLLRSLLIALLFVYIGSQSLHGERGIYAWYRDAKLLEATNKELEQKIAQREELEHNVKHLRSDALDLDLLDEQTRRMLGGLKEGEVLVLTPERMQHITPLNHQHSEEQPMSISAKRRAPAEVPALELNGIRYEQLMDAPPPGKQGLEQGWLRATDMASGNVLWVQQIYKVAYDPETESDVQDVYFSRMEAAKDGQNLIIRNEMGDEFRVDGKTGASTAHPSR